MCGKFRKQQKNSKVFFQQSKDKSKASCPSYDSPSCNYSRNQFTTSGNKAIIVLEINYLNMSGTEMDEMEKWYRIPNTKCIMKLEKRRDELIRMRGEYLYQDSEMHVELERLGNEIERLNRQIEENEQNKTCL